MTTAERAFAAKYENRRRQQPALLKFYPQSPAANVFYALTCFGLLIGTVGAALTQSPTVFLAGAADAIVCGFAAAVINRLDAIIRKS